MRKLNGLCQITVIKKQNGKEEREQDKIKTTNENLYSTKIKKSNRV